MERFRKFWYAIMSLIDDKWRILFDKYRIEREIEKHGRFYITADQIREVKEPRLMTKFDTRESLPRVFGKKISILPVSRGGYVLGEFDLYQDFPEIPSDIKRVTSAKIPDYFESIDLHDIRSEASAINVMSITGILDDFLGEARMVQTVSGRMGSGNFEFYVSDYQKSEPIEKKPLIQVQNSQVEIDGGFENENVFTLIEGKNVVHSNFLIRQLYYPARLWAEKIHKPIRPVFMVYSNNIFRLLEYEFTDLRYYNSLRLVQELFGHLGLVQPVASRLLGIAGTLSGCGPAFVSMFIEALGDAGVKHGLPRAMAYRLAGQMVAGTGRMQVETGAHPGAMKDAVCSPGGTTIVGVAELERGGMRAAVINAVDAIQNK